MQLLFHLGSTAALSLAELRAVVPGLTIERSGAGWIAAELERPPMIDRLGGTVRIARLRSFEPVPEAELRGALLAQLIGAHREGRMEFGISVLEGELSIRTLGLELKAALQQRGIRARVAGGQDRTLASVLVRKKGVVELVVAKSGDGWLLGRTGAIQDIGAYVFRDTHKPARNLERGMLPPKLAQVLLNLADAPAGTITLDPFCGTGTVLIEALVQARAVRGCDADREAVEESRANLAWYGKILQEDFDPKWAFQADATTLSDVANVGGMATEGTLGRMLHQEPTPEQAERTFTEVAAIYKPFFASAAALLPPGGKLAMTVPAFRTAGGTRTFPAAGFRQLLPRGLELVPLLPKDLAARFAPRLTEKGGIVVERPDQFVAREVILLQRAV